MLDTYLQIENILKLMSVCNATRLNAVWTEEFASFVLYFRYFLLLLLLNGK